MKRARALSVCVIAVSALTAILLPHVSAFPGRNGRLVFRSDAPIVSSNPDGTDVRVLADSGHADFEPAWSADGRKIVFVSARDGQQELFTMKADGSQQKMVTSNPVTATSVANDFNPGWSPDSKKIVFEHQDGRAFTGIPQIHVMNEDGSGRLNLTKSDNGGSGPAWSPDGTLIAFSSSNPSGVYVMKPDGSGRRLLKTRGGGPSWSPDGRKIAYTGVCGTRESGGICVMNSDGTGATQLTEGPDESPAWSPDGRFIAFETSREGKSQIYVMNVDGTGMHRISDPKVRNVTPDWQPLDPPAPPVLPTPTVGSPAGEGRAGPQPQPGAAGNGPESNQGSSTGAHSSSSGSGVASVEVQLAPNPGGQGESLASTSNTKNESKTDLLRIVLIALGLLLFIGATVVALIWNARSPQPGRQRLSK